jgi:hypothetical protein
MGTDHESARQKAGGAVRTTNLACAIIAALFVLNFLLGLVRIPLWLVLIILVCDIVVDRVVVHVLRSGDRQS